MSLSFSQIELGATLGSLMRPRPNNPFARPRRPEEVAPGITLLGSERVNFYAIAEGRSLTLVDCGFFGHLRYLEAWLAETSRKMTDIEAVVITHGDGDHLGFASVFDPLGIPVYVPEPDLDDARAKQRAPVAKILRNWFRPACFGLLLESHFDSASSQPPVANALGFRPGETLDVPGRPRTVHVPGHSAGHCCLYFSANDVLVGGDALMTFNIFTGRRGVWTFCPHDRRQDRASLEHLTHLEPFGSAALLPGHGDPWTEPGSVGRALAAARIG